MRYDKINLYKYIRNFLRDHCFRVNCDFLINIIGAIKRVLHLKIMEGETSFSHVEALTRSTTLIVAICRQTHPDA